MGNGISFGLLIIIYFLIGVGNSSLALITFPTGLLFITLVVFLVTIPLLPAAPGQVTNPVTKVAFHVLCSTCIGSILLATVFTLRLVTTIYFTHITNLSS